MDEIYGRIYCIFTNFNDKVYIGQTTKTIEKRLQEHFRISKYSDYYIHRAIIKYGKENFFIKEIDISYNKEELNEKEKKYILEYNSFISEKGYNLTMGGEGNIPNEETHQKMKGENNPMFGRHHSDETKKLIGESKKGEKNYWFGKHPSEKTRKKLSEWQKGEKSYWYGKTGKDNPHSKKVICMETGEIFDAITNVERKYGYHRSGVSRCCIGIRQTTGGFHWQYI